jgi:hypothetical protein
MEPGLTAFTRMRRSFKSVAMSARTNARQPLWRYKHYSFAGDDGGIQDNRCSIRQQRQRLLHREKEPFHIDAEDRVIVLLRYRAEGSILHNSGIREDNIELAFLSLDLREQAIKNTKVRHISLDAGHIAADLLQPPEPTPARGDLL